MGQNSEDKSRLRTALVKRSRLILGSALPVTLRKEIQAAFKDSETVLAEIHAITTIYFIGKEIRRINVQNIKELNERATSR